MRVIIINIAIILIGAGLSIACHDQEIIFGSKNSEPRSTPHEISNTNGLSAQKSKLHLALGCWSSGNGDVLRIGENKIYLSTDGFKPVSYVEQADTADNGYTIIRLIDRPQFYFFQEIVLIDVKTDPKWHFVLSTLDIPNTEALEKSTDFNRASWVKDDCTKWPLKENQNL